MLNSTTILGTEMRPVVGARESFALHERIYNDGWRNEEAHRSLGGFPHSNDVKLERETGFEPATLCLGSRCATIAPLSRAGNVAVFSRLVKPTNLSTSCPARNVDSYKMEEGWFANH